LPLLELITPPSKECKTVDHTKSQKPTVVASLLLIPNNAPMIAMIKTKITDIKNNPEIRDITPLDIKVSNLYCMYFFVDLKGISFQEK
jgi:hypothetical protein